jgi:hypothetical protein
VVVAKESVGAAKASIMLEHIVTVQVVAVGP